MCTAISFCAGDHYFGRNLDLERSYGEKVVITPRNYPLQFRNGTLMTNHYAMIGMATVVSEQPLYFETTNECGLSIAGLNFAGNAKYAPFQAGHNNVAPFELPTWLLGDCDTVSKACEKLEEMNLWAEDFSKELPCSPLHWMISDKKRSIVFERTEDGARIYEDPVGVLTNNPPFPYHLHNLTNYMQLTDAPPVNRQPIPLTPYSLGAGSFGLPGDLSSSSRFVKAAFTKLHSKCEYEEKSAVSQFFHILGSVTQQRGVTQLPTGEYEFTQYTSCCNTDKGLYYYKTYDDHRIRCIDMYKEALDSSDLILYLQATGCSIHHQN